MSYQKVVDGYLDEQIALNDLKPKLSEDEEFKNFGAMATRAIIVSMYIEANMLKQKYDLKLNITKEAISGAFTLIGIGGAIANHLTGYDSPILLGASVGVAAGAFGRFLDGFSGFIKSVKICRQYKVVVKNWSALAFCPKFIDDFCKVNGVQFLEDPFEDRKGEFKQIEERPFCFPTPEMAGRQFACAAAVNQEA